MNKTYLLCRFLIFALAISSCSSELNQRPVATSTLQSYPAPNPEGEYPTLIPTNSAKIPVTWASRNLSGKLVYSLGALDEDNNLIVQIQVLDLLTGNVTVLYKAIKDAWIYYVSVSPNGKAIIMSYSPPPQSDPHIAQALYVLPLDNSQPPELLLMPRVREDQYTQAEWSPDGKYIYYTYVNYLVPNDPNRLYPYYKIFRMEYPGGQSELIAEQAYWPRLSSDASRLVYVSLDPFSGEYHLKIADPDGGNAQDVVLFGPYIPHDKEAPFFSPDGKSIIFSGEVIGQAYQPSWLEAIMGIRAAKANGLLSDWWSVPVGGGEITRLTYLQSTALYASVSPDNQHIVSYSGDHIYVMNPDGSGLTILIPGLNHFYGTVNWLP